MSVYEATLLNFKDFFTKKARFKHKKLPF